MVYLKKIKYNVPFYCVFRWSAQYRCWTSNF